ncbi:YpdA family putative bacillithiol disulfide reductase [Laceyella putida]|uniref:YpdA family putative bacillithiol disulfide reductase n=1 Tax=Laceyella putida TaxID=110101 RepID=A0ABW2RMG2_9BACL
MFDVIVVGAGPCGLSAAIELQKEGLEPLIIEKGCLVNSIYHYPLSMTFFSSADNLEIGGIPFTTVNEKPTRYEALAYFRTVVRKHHLELHTYEKVVEIERLKEGFRVMTSRRDGRGIYEVKYVVLATGYYDNPNLMNIPGEDLPHVKHYFHDAHPYAGDRVVVIGGRNSAIDVALDLHHVGAHVTMVYRKNSFHDSVKAWVRPLIETAIEKERIHMHWGAEVREITPRAVVIEKDGELTEIPADAVFAMTGYRPNLSFVERLGGEIDHETGVPILSDAMETTVPGLFLAGVIATGHDATKVFIENGRYHGRSIARHIRDKQKLTCP